MRNTGGNTNDNRSVILFANLICGFHEILAFLAVAGFKARSMCASGKHPRVLLVLRGMHSGVIGNNEYHAGINTGIGCCEEGVGTHIQTDMLHAGKTASAAYCCTECNLDGDLFVGCPFGIDLGIVSNVLVDFGAGSSGICA